MKVADDLVRPSARGNASRGVSASIPIGAKAIS